MTDLQKISELAKTIENLATRIEGVRHLSHSDQTRITQARELGAITRDLEGVTEEAIAFLNEPRTAKSQLGKVLVWILRRKAYVGLSRDNLRIHLVNAALLELQVGLLKIRVDANSSWFRLSTQMPDRRQEIKSNLARFRARLDSAHVKLTALNCHTIASALRSWSDELSVARTSASGWIEAAIPVSRELRFLANAYDEKSLWRSIFDSRYRESVFERLGALAHALLLMVFRLLSGYGLKGERFVLSLLAFLIAFAAVYGGMDVLSGCGAPAVSVDDVVRYIQTSLVFLVGGPGVPQAQQGNTACQAILQYTSAIGTIEALIGYLMLGLLISLIWSAIQRHSLETSKIEIPEK